MSQCPHINLLSLDAYVGGMPYEELAKVRQQGSMVYMDDPENGVPYCCLLYTSPSPRDKRQSRMPSSA